MGVVFSEGREMPKQLRHQMSGYGYTPRGTEPTAGTGSDGAAIVGGVAEAIRAASPWDFLSDWLFKKPAAEAAAQAQILQTQSQAYAMQQEQRAKTLRIVAIAGVALVGVIALVAARRRKPAKVSGYRKRRRR